MYGATPVARPMLLRALMPVMCPIMAVLPMVRMPMQRILDVVVFMLLRWIVRGFLARGEGCPALGAANTRWE